jgi:hypothetical protein
VGHVDKHCQFLQVAYFFGSHCKFTTFAFEKSAEAMLGNKYTFKFLAAFLAYWITIILHISSGIFGLGAKIAAPLFFYTKFS